MSDRKYFPVLIIRNVGAYPTKGTDLDLLIMSKAKQMVDAGKMVKGSCPIFADKAKPPIADLDYTSWFTNYNLIHTQEMTENHDVSAKFSTGAVEPKSIRVFTSEAAANEWITFITGLDAQQAMILTAEQALEFVNPWPDDSVFDQYVATQP
jgi:hypothetical protein